MKIFNPNKHDKFSHKEFGGGKNVDKEQEKLYPCKIFLNSKGKAILILK